MHAPRKCHAGFGNLQLFVLFQHLMHGDSNERTMITDTQLLARIHGGDLIPKEAMYSYHFNGPNLKDQGNMNHRPGLQPNCRSNHSL